MSNKSRSLTIQIEAPVELTLTGEQLWSLFWNHFSPPVSDLYVVSPIGYASFSIFDSNTEDLTFISSAGPAVNAVVFPSMGG